MIKIPLEKSSSVVREIYVVTCWSGKRRVVDNRYAKDKCFYLRNHVDFLNKIEHSLNLIVFVINENKQEPDEYKRLVFNLPKKIGTADTKIIRRENVGMSYGALSDVWNLYKDSYDYYFTIEDDYQFSVNNFDKIFIKKLEDNKLVGYVSCLAGKTYADISVGCIREKALADLAKINNGVLYPYPSNAKLSHTNYDDVYKYGQFNFGVGLRAAGWDIVDLRDRYGCVFKDPPGSTRSFFSHNKKNIVLPI
jgi:hypothetical protein